MSAPAGGRPEPRPGSRALAVIVMLAVLYTLYFAREFLLPITLALLLTFLLRPAVRALGRHRVPLTLAAGLVLAGLFGVAGFGVYELSGPIQSWATNAPETIAPTNGT